MAVILTPEQLKGIFDDYIQCIICLEIYQKQDAHLCLRANISRCPCGGKFKNTKSGRNQHEKSMRHKFWMSNAPRALDNGILDQAPTPPPTPMSNDVSPLDRQSSNAQGALDN